MSIDKRILKFVLEIFALYVACSVYAFLLSRCIELVRNSFPTLWLLILPLEVFVLILLLYFNNLKRWTKLFYYSIIGLSLNSILATLYFKLCESDYDHTSTSFVITIVILVFCSGLAVALFIKKKVAYPDILRAVVAMITFEIATRIEFLSIVILLNKLFPLNYQ